MTENVIDQKPISFEDWTNLGEIIVPWANGQAIAPNWTSNNFKLTKEEWDREYADSSLGLRLDNIIDIDVDNYIVKRFINSYLLTGSACIFGRKTNVSSHYLWKGESKFKQFIIPEQLKEYCKNFAHGATLCEIRSGRQRITVVPESIHNKSKEKVVWEKFEGLKEYKGDIEKDMGKLALATALSIMYPAKGNRDTYCTAIAGILINNAKWSPKDVDAFILNLAQNSDDEELHLRDKKGTNAEKGNKNLGIPTLAKTLKCDQKTISDLFSWVNVKSKRIDQIEKIIEYGSDRYFVHVNGIVRKEFVQKVVTVSGSQLRDQNQFIDLVIKHTGIWIPKIKNHDYERQMNEKFQERELSGTWVEEAEENQRFIEYFRSYIRDSLLWDDKDVLKNDKLPYYDKDKEAIEFDFRNFEEYLQKQRVKLDRADFTLAVQNILKAKKKRGKHKGKSLVSWVIYKPEGNLLELRDNMIVQHGQISEEKEEDK